MSDSVRHATIVGDGAMGTVCALILAGKGTRVTLWSAFPEQAAAIESARENRRFLPGFRLPDHVRAISDVTDAFTETELIVSAVPCQFIRPVWRRLTAHYRRAVPVVTVSKGIEIDTLLTSTAIVAELLGDVPLVAMSGPSIAPELAERKPCTVVAASRDLTRAQQVQAAFSTDYFRVYTNDDLIGVETAGATKNVIALAAGIVDGIGAGCNAKAALLTRGVVEISRLGVAMGARPETFTGLAGVGDLITTCISPIGRNRSAGEQIGRGMSAAEVVASTPSVIEGIPTTRAVLQLAERHKVEMPITAAVAAVLDGRKPPGDAIADLMTRRLKRE